MEVSAEKWKPVTPQNLDATGQALVAQLWHRNQLQFLLHPGQRVIWDAISKSQSKTHVFNVGRQWGKSTLCVFIAISRALQTPMMRIHYGAPTKLQVKSIIEPKMLEILQTCPLELRPKKAGEDTWLFPNGSTLKVVGVNIQRGERLRGLTSDLVILDECRSMDNLEDLIDSIVEPMFNTTDGELILVSTPPDSPAHPFTSKYITQAIKGGYYYHATYQSNPNISRSKLKEINEMDPNSDTFRREYLADYEAVSESKKVIKNYYLTKDDEFFKTWKPEDAMNTYVGIDLGGVDQTAVIFACYDHINAVLVIIGEEYLNNPTTDDIAEVILAGEDRFFSAIMNSQTRTTRVSDISPFFFRDMKKHNLPIIPVSKRTQDAMLNGLNIRVDQDQIRVHPSCVTLRNQLALGVWNDKKTSYERSSGGDHLDGLDALKYITMYIKWNEVPRAEALPTQPGQVNFKAQVIQPKKNLQTLIGGLKGNNPFSMRR